MATIDDLHSELKRLRGRVRQLESGNVPPEDNVSLIVSEDANDRSRAGGFAAACHESRNAMITAQKEAARRQLKSSPGLYWYENRVAERAFRADYSAVPSS